MRIKIYKADSNCCTNPLPGLTLIDNSGFAEYDIGMHKVRRIAG
jgi:hypothetical protein